MKKQRNKSRRTKGLGLSELLVVLTVTLVLAAILMPALASQDPKRAEEILSSTVQSSLQPTDEMTIKRPTVASRIERNSRRDAQRRGDDAAESTALGIEKMITTDIRGGRR